MNKKTYKKKIKPVPPDLDTLLEEVKSKMGEEFYNKLVKAIEESNSDHFHAGIRDEELKHDDPYLRNP